MGADPPRSAPDWSVPQHFRDVNAGDPDRLVWAEKAPGQAAALARRWSLSPDGAARAGHMGLVRPVRDAAGRSLVLKLGCSPEDLAREAVALQAWAGSGAVVDVVAVDATEPALLLDRLDAEQDLAGLADADAAVAVAGSLLARARRPAPPGVPALAVELERILAAVEEHLAKTPGLLAPADVAAARSTLTDLIAERATRATAWLCHGDAHFENILHTLPGEDPGWRLIDPLPFAGRLEIEPIALLRNRFGDAEATGNPDRALRRRIDILGEALDLDRPLTRSLAHAVAVDNLLWLLPQAPGHPFVAAYEVLLGWRP